MGTKQMTDTKIQEVTVYRVGDQEYDTREEAEMAVLRDRIETILYSCIFDGEVGIHRLLKQASELHEAFGAYVEWSKHIEWSKRIEEGEKLK
jgi:hypothetical protein